MELEGKNKAKFVEYIYSITNPVRAHEAAIISSILGFKMGQHLWRFRKNHFCGGCNRELTALDYFLSALRTHSVDFLRTEVLGDIRAEDADRVEFQFETSLSNTRIEIARHTLNTVCVVCGFENPGNDPNDPSSAMSGRCDIYFYKHPGPGGGNPPTQQGVNQTIRVGAGSFDAIVKKLELDVA